MKKKMCLLLAVILLALAVTGCGGRLFSGNGASSGSSIFSTSNVVSGYWGEKFVRSNGYTYPFMFDEPLRQCVGFTLYYEITEVNSGNLDGNFMYEAYVHTVDGSWKSVELFRMDGYSATLNIRLEDPMGIDGVAVVCGKKGELSYSQAIEVRDPIY